MSSYTEPCGNKNFPLQRSSVERGKKFKFLSRGDAEGAEKNNIKTKTKKDSWLF